MTEQAADPTVEETGAQGAGEPPAEGARRLDDSADAVVSEEPLTDRSHQVDDPQT